MPSHSSHKTATAGREAISSKAAGFGPARAGFRFPGPFSHAARRVFILHRAKPFHPRHQARFHLFPNSWLILQRTAHRKRNPACGWTKSGPWPVEILTLFGRNLRAPPADGKARRTFVLRALFTLAAIYSRGTCRPTTIDVLMFHFRVRNGTGWGHQAMTTRLQEALLGACCLPWLSSALAGCFLFFSGRLASAWLVLCVSCSSLTPLHLIQAEIACHRGGV